MAYTGTGTQADPYVVTNLPDLLTCIEIGQCYIKVANDIDCALEPTYTGKIVRTDKGLDLTGIHLYSDGGYSIIGLTLEAFNFFICGNASPGDGYIENLNFINCCFKQKQKTTWNGGIFDGNNSTWRLRLNNCKFSFVASMAAFDYALFTWCIAEDCSFYIKVNGASYRFPFAINAGITMTRCSVVIDGCKVSMPYATSGILFGSANNTYSAGTFDTTSIIYKNCDFNWGQTTIYIAAAQYYAFTNPNPNGYVALLDCTLQGRTDDNGTPFTVDGSPNTPSGAISLVSSNTMTLGTNSIIKPISIANLKDKQYLVDIGFLP